MAFLLASSLIPLFSAIGVCSSLVLTFFPSLQLQQQSNIAEPSKSLPLLTSTARNNSRGKHHKMASTQSVPAKREAEAKGPQNKRRKTSKGSTWEEIDTISHIRRVTPVTEDNQGFEYLVHWSAPGQGCSWISACDITTLALHEFWINNYQTVAVGATGYEPSLLETPSPSVSTATLREFASPASSIRSIEIKKSDSSSDDNHDDDKHDDDKHDDDNHDDAIHDDDIRDDDIHDDDYHEADE
ncbi:hypothetical protein F4782DRAFT_535976 [Xylaria castorea]|nr:hypothetical protein F4782DRAFT_535976 [Xylaria castorea]